MKRLFEKIKANIKANYHLYVDAYERTSTDRYTHEQDHHVEYKRSNSKVIPFAQRTESNRKKYKNQKEKKAIK